MSATSVEVSKYINCLTDATVVYWCINTEATLVMASGNFLPVFNDDRSEFINCFKGIIKINTVPKCPCNNLSMS